MLLSPARVVFVVSAKHNWLKRRLGGSQANYLKAIIRNKSTVEKGFVEIRDGSVFSSLSQTRSSPFRISEEVYEAILKNSHPVVALESAIITHGMPYPHNIETALHLENIIRHKGVIPATVGVIEGQLTVGLSHQDIETLGSAVKEKCPGSSKSRVVKVSRRDLPYTLSQRLNGGTTVSGTIIGAVGAKIPIFVTGGLGGVHRGAESTFDISADLKELGRSPIAVISAGVKSILDIGKTLEYLETEGVCVCVLDSKNKGKKKNTRSGEEALNGNENDGEDIPVANIRSIKFPSFFTSESPFPAPHVLDNEIEAANLLHSSFRLALGSGILIAVPIPEEFATSGERIEKAIERALEDARKEGINGKDMTPFLLGKVNELTGGDSLEANKHLIENNALVGAEIALELLRLRKETVGEEMLSSGINSGDNSHSQSHHLNGGHYHYVPGTTPGSPTGGGLGNCQLKNVSSAVGNVGIEKKRTKNPTNSSPTPTTTVRGYVTATNCPLSLNDQPNCGHSLKTDQAWNCEKFKGEERNPSEPKSSRLNDETHTKSYHSFSSSGRPVVIGGTSLDLVLSVQEEAIVSDGRTHRTKIRTVAGGVGRNMAEALQKLGHSPLFISAIGNDLFGRELVRNFEENQMDMAGILTTENPTAIYSALLNHKGECVFGLGDMTAHCDISSDMLKDHIEDIRRASIVLLDGNIPTETMTTVFEICSRYSVPLWFEPTEIRKAQKILEVPRQLWSSLRYISPNLRELISMTAFPSSEAAEAEFATLEKGFDNFHGEEENEENKGGDNSPISMNIIDMNINEILTAAGNSPPTPPTLSHLISRCFSLFTGLEIILLTRGSQGFFVLERHGKSFSGRHFPAPDIQPEDLMSVSGAGDCLNAGFISGLLHQLPLEMCGSRGTHCAKKSLKSTSNVPVNFKLANNENEEDVFVQY